MKRGGVAGARAAARVCPARAQARKRAAAWEATWSGSRRLCVSTAPCPRGSGAAGPATFCCHAYGAGGRLPRAR